MITDEQLDAMVPDLVTAARRRMYLDEARDWLLLLLLAGLNAVVWVGLLLGVDVIVGSH